MFAPEKQYVTQLTLQRTRKFPLYTWCWLLASTYPHLYANLNDTKRNAGYNDWDRVKKESIKSCWWKSKLALPLRKSVWKILKNLKSTIWSSCIIPVYTFKVTSDTCNVPVILEIITVVKLEGQPVRSSAGEWIHLVFIQILSYLAIKWTKLLGNGWNWRMYVKWSKVDLGRNYYYLSMLFRIYI